MARPTQHHQPKFWLEPNLKFFHHVPISMMWDLGSVQAKQFFKCWNTCVKLVNDVPRSKFTFLVEGFFAAGQTSLRNQVIFRYSGFFRILLHTSEDLLVLPSLSFTAPPGSELLFLLRKSLTVRSGGLASLQTCWSWRMRDIWELKTEVSVCHDGQPVQHLRSDQLWFLISGWPQHPHYLGAS